jgi:hypothetical protein
MTFWGSSSREALGFRSDNRTAAETSSDFAKKAETDHMESILITILATKIPKSFVLELGLDRHEFGST